MAKTWMIIACLALLPLAGGGAYLLLSASNHQGGESFETIPSYVEMESLAAPVMRKGRLSHYIHIVVTLEVADRDKIEGVEGRIPALRDAFLRELYRAPVAGQGEYSNFDLKAAKSRLLEVAREVVGEGLVSDVLVMQTIRGPA